MIEAAWIVLAFIFGLTFRKLGLPSLVGFLVAGFVLNYIGNFTGYRLDYGDTLKHLAHIGVLLLLFTVGLKLRLKSIIQPEVLGGSLIHLAVFGGLCLAAFYYLVGINWQVAVLLAVSLGFSSTVIAATVLEAKRELRAFHGRVAIGVLIIQDLVALFVLSIGGGSVPSPWAILVLGLPFMVPLLHRLVNLTGHDELFVLLGLLFALVIGGFGFESVGLSSELGALLLGALLANHSRAQELGKSLWGIKEIFLIGFFLQIGMSGLPNMQDFIIALLLLLLLPLKMLLFFLVLLGFKLRARSAFLTALSLASYSEFGLIVAAALLPEWTVTLALTVALSFAIAAPLNRLSHSIYERLESRLVKFELTEHHPDEQPVSLGRANIVVMGMGRLGTAAYDFLTSQDERAVGLDADPGKVQLHLSQGRRVLYADAEDPGFWHGLKMDNVHAVILGLNDREAKINAARQLRQRGFQGLIVTTSLYDGEAEALLAAGANQAFLAYNEAGVGLAEHVRRALDTESQTLPSSQ